MIETILARIKDLEAGVEQALANVHATKGALQEARSIYQSFLRNTAEATSSQDEIVPVE